MHPFEFVYKKYNINQNQLAVKMDVSPRLLSDSVRRNAKIENVKFGTISKMAKALNISIDQLGYDLINFEKEGTGLIGKIEKTDGEIIHSFEKKMD